MAPLVFAVPYLIGAPHPEGPMFLDRIPATRAPEALATGSVNAAAFTKGVFWLAPGSLAVLSGVRTDRAMAAADGDLSIQADP